MNEDHIAQSTTGIFKAVFSNTTNHYGDENKNLSELFDAALLLSPVILFNMY